MGKQLRHLADTADIFGTVFGRKAEVFIQTMADIVTIEYVCLVAGSTAMVDLPEPESPVSQTVTPFWRIKSILSCFVILPWCHVMFVLFCSDIFFPL
jgi:hypothetical protein